MEAATAANRRSTERFGIEKTRRARRLINGKVGHEPNPSYSPDLGENVPL